jgi:acetylornithine deacetylase/succinyl-diaminopimelate desuccinylase-like protein
VFPFHFLLSYLVIFCHANLMNNDHAADPISAQRTSVMPICKNAVTELARRWHRIACWGLSVAASALAMPVQAQTAGDKWHDAGRALFEKVVTIPTVQGRGKMPEMTALLRQQFEQAGITNIAIKPHDDTQLMIIRWKGSGGKKPILLMAHMDVVEAKREDWSFDPFAFREEAGYFYGRGSVDNKAGVVAIVNTLARLKAEGFKPKRDIIVLFTGDEETAGKGAELATSKWLDEVRAEYALNTDAGGGGFLKGGEPLGYGIQAAEKTYRTYSFTVRNVGGHSSKPRADNAIYELAAVLKRIEAFSFTPQMNEVTRAYFTQRGAMDKGALGNAMRRWVKDPNDRAAADIIEADPTEVGTTRTRCVATRLEGGHADNALPQMAKAIVNCRILPGEDPKDVQAALTNLAGPGVEVNVDDAFGAPTQASPLRPDVMQAFTDAVRDKHPGMPIIPQMSTGATDGVFFRAIGIPVYGVGGEWLIIPEDERAHGRDERIPVKSFYDNLDIWHDMVAKLAG